MIETWTKRGHTEDVESVGGVWLAGDKERSKRRLKSHGYVIDKISGTLCFLLDRLMPVTYSQFLTLIATALRDENGLDLAYLIRPVSAHSKDLIKEFRNPTVRRFSLSS